VDQNLVVTGGVVKEHDRERCNGAQTIELKQTRI
jgi:hypothetical protein